MANLSLKEGEVNNEKNSCYRQRKLGHCLAVMLDKYGHDVTIWSWKEEEARRIREDGEHKEFLPGVPIRKRDKNSYVSGGSGKRR